jgi:alkylhydroperoxidase family enzyme
MDDRFAALRKATEAAVFGGGGETPSDLRRAVAEGQAPPDLALLTERIRSRAHSVTDTDIDSLRVHYSDDQLFELIVAATFGAASERLAAALRALEDA